MLIIAKLKDIAIFYGLEKVGNWLTKSGTVGKWVNKSEKSRELADKVKNSWEMGK